MGGHAYIEREDLGLTVLGTTQYTYSVGGVHRQEYDRAIFQASMCRATALEYVTASVEQLVKGRQQKLDDLGLALAEISRCMRKKDEDKEGKSSTKYEFDASVASTLRKYGFSASSMMSYEELAPLQEDVKYAIDRENNELKQDMSDIQNYVTKRDDSMKTVDKLLKKVAKTRSDGIGNIGS